MPDHDVVVVGDGPAAAAVADSCADVGLGVTVVGPGRPWRPTYGTWRDDLPDLPDAVYSSSTDTVLVRTGARSAVGHGGEHLVERAYGVIDNMALRHHFRLDERLRRDTMVAINDRGATAVVELVGGAEVSADVVIDATGAATSVPKGWQTAYGVVVDEHQLAGRWPTDSVTLMDWAPDATAGSPTFCYVVPVADGWLIEETVLAATPAIDPVDLRPRLVERLGEATVAGAEAAGNVEQVRIPMGTSVARARGRIVPFGAAAGMIHPASGYSLAASLRAAPRVAQAIAAGGDLERAVWPTAARRARALHDYGLDALLRLDAASTRDFFEAFFSLPVDAWSGYLRVDTTARVVADVMREVFRRVPWSVRRQLVRVDPRLAARLVRP